MPNKGTQNKNKYWLPPHIRVCVTATGAVVLDLKRNRYFGIGDREVRSLCALASNWADMSTSAASPVEPTSLNDATRLAGALLNAGLLTAEIPVEQPFSVHSADLNAAPTTYETRYAAAVNLVHIVNFLRASFWAKRAVTSRLLYSIACEVSERKRKSTAATDEQRTVELVGVFRRLRPYAFAAKDQCLFHALALLKFLSYYDIFPTWVIAVRPAPWAAHSWLQLGSLALDCSPEELDGYTPILAI